MEWIIFAAIVGALFTYDLCAKGSRTFAGASIRTAVYVVISLTFGAYVWITRGVDDGLKFLTGYVLEASLSLDNVFVISLIFGALAIPRELRQRVLTIGILSALVLRGIFIGAGTALAGRFEWVLVICGAFLIYTGVKSLVTGEEAEVDLETNRAFRLLRRIVPVTHVFHGQRFFVREAGRLCATPLLVALVLVEIADVVFAADSVPATLAVTTDPFLVYTSNVFAILGLRALYQVLEAVVNDLEYVGKAVAAVLIFVGVKVCADHLIDFHIHNGVSLMVVVIVLGSGVLLSLAKRSADGKARHESPPGSL